MATVQNQLENVSFEQWKEEALSTLDFINYLNLMLPLVDPINEEDKPAIPRFAKIGIAPGVSFANQYIARKY